PCGRVSDANAGLGGDLGKMTAAVVVIEVRKDAGKIARRAVSASDLGKLVGRGDVELGRPSNVIAGKQIELAVVVVIDKSRAGAPAVGSAARARFGSYV